MTASHETRRDAFEAVNLNRMEAEVFACIKSAETDITPDEIADLLSREVTSIRPRVSGLRDKGLIEDSGEKRAWPGRRPAAAVRVKQSGDLQGRLF